MQKFIHDDFEIDLSSYSITRVDENQWFSDEFFTKYTFPFEIKLTDEINLAFGLIDNHNISNPVTYYKGFFFVDAGHSASDLEIKDVFNKVATTEISYGLDELPNFDKKLSELPLQKNDLAESLFDHAETIIDKSWPVVNYNFPQVHTESFDPEDDRWQGFEEIINNYRDGAFLVNEFDVAENITYNRNIMIPMPYYMHVLITGFEDAGYTLKGDVLENEWLQKTCFFTETEEYVNARIEGEEILTDIADDYNLVTVVYRFGAFNLRKITRQLGSYSTTYNFPKRGRYKISGNVYLRRNFSDAKADLLFKGENIFSTYNDFIRNNGVSENSKFVNVVLDVDDILNPLTLTSRQIVFREFEEEQVNEGPLWDLTITPLAIYDENDDLIPPLITSSKLDLTKCVPDRTFGDFVKMIKNKFNMDLIPDGREIHMNYIQPQMNVNNAIDLNQFNAKRPRRRFSQSSTYLLKVRDVDHESYNPISVFIDLNGPQTSGFQTTDDTNEIEIDYIPLPIVFKNGVTTALAVDDGTGDICAVVYEGKPNQLNVAQDNSGILVPDLYEGYWNRWLDFRVKSQGFDTDFRSNKFHLRNLKVNSKVYMYQNYFIIRIMNRTNIPGTDLFDVELELESLN